MCMCISQILVKFHSTAVCFITHTHGLATGACVRSLCGNSEVVYAHMYMCAYKTPPGCLRPYTARNVIVTEETEFNSVRTTRIYTYIYLGVG